MMADVVSIDEATTAVKARAWSDDESGRVLIHTFAGSVGVDWDVDTAVAFIERSTEREWLASTLGHDLQVRADGRWVRFDCPHPLWVTS